MKNLILPIIALAVLGLAACTPKEEGGTDSPEPSTSGGTVDSTPVVAYSDIDTILQNNCSSCHSGAQAKEGFDVSSYDSVAKGTEHGAVFVAGKSEESLLYKVLIGDGAPKMPPGGDGLSPADVEKVKAWIDAGATK